MVTELVISIPLMADIILKSHFLNVQLIYHSVSSIFNNVRFYVAFIFQIRAFARLEKALQEDKEVSK